MHELAIVHGIVEHCNVFGVEVAARTMTLNYGSALGEVAGSRLTTIAHIAN